MENESQKSEEKTLPQQEQGTFNQERMEKARRSILEAISSVKRGYEGNRGFEKSSFFMTCITKGRSGIFTRYDTKLLFGAETVNVL